MEKYWEKERKRKKKSETPLVRADKGACNRVRGAVAQEFEHTYTHTYTRLSFYLTPPRAFVSRASWERSKTNRAWFAVCAYAIQPLSSALIPVELKSATDDDEARRIRKRRSSTERSKPETWTRMRIDFKRGREREEGDCEARANGVTTNMCSLSFRWNR